jgi:hypothetical protein
MQYKIPQNVQRADTIIGPITFPQLGILLVGGGLTYTWYLVLANTYYWYIWIWPVAFTGILTLAMAFLKIHDMTFVKFFLYLIEFMSKPKQRFWRKGDMEYYHSVMTPLAKTDAANTSDQTFAEEQLEKKQKLRDLTDVLDNQ